MEPVTPIITALLGYGPTGILLAIIFLLGKMYIKKTYTSLVTFIENQEKSSSDFKESMKGYNDLLTKVVDTEAKIEKSQNKFVDAFIQHAADDQRVFDRFAISIDEIKDNVKELKQSTSGNLSDTQVSNILGIYSGKVHAQVLNWWNERRMHNHILESPHLVKQRYTDRYFECVTKWHSELAQFRYMGLPLDRFDGGGIAYMYSDIFKVLYEIQLAEAKGSEPTYQPDKIVDYLDRKQSIIMGAGRTWCSTGKTLLETLKEQSTQDHKAGDIQWLTAEALDFTATDPSSKYFQYGER
jgi:hypothetical protein